MSVTLTLDLDNMTHRAALRAALSEFDSETTPQFELPTMQVEETDLGPAVENEKTAEWATDGYSEEQDLGAKFANWTNGDPIEQERLDTNGVPFDERFCANAKDPYYGTGKRTGQWKKARGVDDAAYDAWYAGQIGATNPPPTPPTETEKLAPTTAGEFFTFVAKEQAEGRITPAHMQSAYSLEGLSAEDVMSPDAAHAENAIARLYARLVS